MLKGLIQALQELPANLRRDRNDSEGNQIVAGQQRLVTTHRIVVASNKMIADAIKYVSAIKRDDGNSLSFCRPSGQSIIMDLDQIQTSRLLSTAGVPARVASIIANRCAATFTVLQYVAGDTAINENGEKVLDDNGNPIIIEKPHCRIQSMQMHLPDQLALQLAIGALAVPEHNTTDFAGFSNIGGTEVSETEPETKSEKKAPVFVAPVRKNGETDAKYQQRLQTSIANYRNKYGVEPVVTDPVIS